MINSFTTHAASRSPKKIVALDLQYANQVAGQLGHRHFPARQFVGLVNDTGADVLECMATIPVFPGGDHADENAARAQATLRCQHALQDAGFRTLMAPAKFTPQLRADGRPLLKHSDDQYLMINVLLTCMRVRPQFVVLVAGDGDYAPLVWGLRDEGIRTEVVADPQSLAADLRRAAYSCTNIRDHFRDTTASNDPGTRVAA